MNLTHKAIYTLTLSPCIDKSTRVEKFVPEKKLQCEHPIFEPGGGGLNVSKVLSRFGITSHAIYISGGYTGKMLDEMVKYENYHPIRIESQLQTRENFIVYEKSSHLQYRFGMPVNEVSKTEQSEILHNLRKAKHGGWLIVSGSAHAGLNKDFYFEIFSEARKKNMKIFCDTDRHTLKKIIPLRPDWIKPNRNEWLHYLGKNKLNEKEWIQTGIQKSVRNKINIVVSDGEKGAWYFQPDGKALFYPSPQGIKVRSTVGAGDSMVAGIVVSNLRGEPHTESVRFGMACAISTVMNPESEFCRPNQVIRWKKNIQFINLI
jgi:6-phosphofructokinase 2